MKRLEGIIIKKREHRESDCIYTIYSKEFGKISVLAKGVRKISAKLRPHLELFNWVECFFVEGSAIRIITDVHAIEPFSAKFIEDDVRLSCAYTLAEYFDGEVYGEEGDPRLWDLLLRNFHILSREDALRTDSIPLFLSYSLLHLSRLSGITPELYQCTLCANPLQRGERYFFRVREGGVVCQHCERSREDFPLDERMIKLLRLMLQGEWDLVRRLKVSLAERQTLQLVSQMVPSYFS